MIAETVSYPRRKLFMESLRGLVSGEHVEVFLKQQRPPSFPQEIQYEAFASTKQLKFNDPETNHKYLKLDVSDIQSVKHDSEETDEAEEQKREIMERIKQRLRSAKPYNQQRVKSSRPTTTCTLNSPIRTRPSTQFSSCRGQSNSSRAARRITEYLSRSPEHKRENASAGNDTDGENQPGLISGNSTLGKRATASQILRRLSYTDNISGCHNFLRKGSSVVRKMMGNFIEHANEKLHQQLQQSAFPYNEKFLRKFNQVVPSVFYEQLEKDRLFKIAQVLKGPQPISATPNSAFFRSVASPPKPNPNPSPSRVSKHSKSNSIVTLKSRCSRKAEITGWDYS